MPPVIRNLLIRLVASIEQAFRWSVRTLSNLLSVLSRLLGLSTAGYYVEEQSTEPAELPPSSEPAQPSLSASPRRRAGKEVDSFRKMAQQIKQQQ